MLLIQSINPVKKDSLPVWAQQIDGETDNMRELQDSFDTSRSR